MVLHYTLNNNDFLQYHLYESSRSKLHNKRRLRTRILATAIYVMIGLYSMYNNDSKLVGILMIITAALVFIFFPFYSRWRYRNHFEKHVETSYKNRIDIPVKIEFGPDSIFSKDFTSESTIKGTEVKQLIEIKNHFFVKLATDYSFIVPKHSINNPIEFKKLLDALGSEYKDETEWRWK